MATPAFVRFGAISPARSPPYGVPACHAHGSFSVVFCCVYDSRRAIRVNLLVWGAIQRVIMFLFENIRCFAVDMPMLMFLNTMQTNCSTNIRCMLSSVPNTHTLSLATGL